MSLIYQTHMVLAKLVREVDVSHIVGSRYVKFVAILGILRATEYETEFVAGISAEMDVPRWYQFLLRQLEPRMFINTVKPRFGDELRLAKYTLLLSLFTDLESYLGEKINATSLLQAGEEVPDLARG